MTQQEQIEYFRVLGIDYRQVTNYVEIEQKKLKLRASGKYTPENATRLNETPYLITDVDAVKKAWKQSCKEFHPDKFDQVAYQKYIDCLKKSNENCEECEVDIVLSKEDMEAMFLKITHAYKMLTDPSYARKNRKNKGQAGLDAIFNIAIDFEQAFFGDSISITFNPIYIDSDGKPDKREKEKDISLDAEIIRIRIKPGTKTGDQVTIPNLGLSQGDRRGNMVITFQVVPHAKFRIDGADVLDSLTVPLELTLVGGVKTITTMWGLRELKIPPGTKPGSSLLIKKHGVGKVGHHCIKIDVDYPDKKDLRHGKVWKKLDIDWNIQEEEDSEEP